MDYIFSSAFSQKVVTITAGKKESSYWDDGTKEWKWNEIKKLVNQVEFYTNITFFYCNAVAGMNDCSSFFFLFLSFDKKEQRMIKLQVLTGSNYLTNSFENDFI